MRFLAVIHNLTMFEMRYIKTINTQTYYSMLIFICMCKAHKSFKKIRVLGLQEVNLKRAIIILDIFTVVYSMVNNSVI
jgi:hypothetical protein